MSQKTRDGAMKLPKMSLDGPVLRRVAPFLSRFIPGHTLPGVERRVFRANGVRIRTYRPEHPTGASLLWAHGGGLVAGSAAMDDRFCSITARDVGVSIVSVDYRLAPKYPYPAAQEDLWAAFEWLLGRESRWGLDLDRIFVGGQSAGGGLAAGLVQRLVDEGKPVAAQWLWCPMLDHRTSQRRDLDDVDYPIWNNQANRYGWSSYLRDVFGPTPPTYASPGTREDLQGMPPTWLYVSDAELFYEEATCFVERLRAADVDVTFDVMKGTPHAVELLAPDAQASKDLLWRGRAWLAQR